jgi:glycosyltransferase involved in cell wall biosynthesis
VVDPYYCIRALHKRGIRLHLHCFEYGRKKQSALEDLCDEIIYYERAEGHKGFSFSLPYIVGSRNNEQLWKRLEKDNYPVFIQGIHCSFGIFQDRLKNRKVVLRLFNVEADYYDHLSKWERSLTKKAFYHHEKRLLARYEKNIAQKTTLLAFTAKDADIYKKRYGARDIHVLPPFMPASQAEGLTGSGNFALYHGNLSVAENEKAATWLLEKIFPELDIPFVIAGKNPSAKLIELAHQSSHTCIVENPSEEEMKDLIRKAQLHILPSFTDTGIKLKLIHALLSGRHVIVNPLMVEGSSLEKICHVADNPALLKYTIYRLYHTPFTDKDLAERTAQLEEIFNEEKQSEFLLKLLY